MPVLLLNGSYPYGNSQLISLAGGSEMLGVRERKHSFSEP